MIPPESNPFNTTSKFNNISGRGYTKIGIFTQIVENCLYIAKWSFKYSPKRKQKGHKTIANIENYIFHDFGPDLNCPNDHENFYSKFFTLMSVFPDCWISCDFVSSNFKSAKIAYATIYVGEVGICFIQTLFGGYVAGEFDWKSHSPYANILAILQTAEKFTVTRREFALLNVF